MNRNLSFYESKMFILILAVVAVFVPQANSVAYDLNQFEKCGSEEQAYCRSILAPLDHHNSMRGSFSLYFKLLPKLPLSTRDQGPNMIFLVGGPGVGLLTYQTFKPFEVLREKMSIAIIEPRGVGNSSIPKSKINCDSMNIEQMVQDVEAVRLALVNSPSEKITLHAHSFGTKIAVQYVKAFDTVSHLILDSPYLGSSGSDHWARRLLVNKLTARSLEIYRENENKNVPQTDINPKNSYIRRHFLCNGLIDAHLLDMEISNPINEYNVKSLRDFICADTPSRCDFSLLENEKLYPPINVSTLLIHGDKDKIVTKQEYDSFKESFENAYAETYRSRYKLNKARVSLSEAILDAGHETDEDLQSYKAALKEFLFH